MSLSSAFASRPPLRYSNQCSVNYFSTIKSDHIFETSRSLPSSTAATNDISNTADINDDFSNSNNESSSPSLLEHYESLIESGEVTRDPHQIRALRELDRLREDCLTYLESPSFHNCGDINNNNNINGSGGSRGGKDNNSGWSIASLFSLTSSSWANPSSSNTKDAALSSSPSNQQHSLMTAGKPKGVYLHGGVGCGKTTRHLQLTTARTTSSKRYTFTNSC